MFCVAEMVAEAILSKNNDSQKYTKVEFKKDKENPSESPNNIPNKNKNEIGTGIGSNMHAYIFGSAIVFVLGILVLKKTSSKNSM